MHSACMHEILIDISFHVTSYVIERKKTKKKKKRKVQLTRNTVSDFVSKLSSVTRSLINNNN